MSVSKFMQAILDANAAMDVLEEHLKCGNVTEDERFMLGLYLRRTDEIDAMVAADRLTMSVKLTEGLGEMSEEKLRELDIAIDRLRPSILSLFDPRRFASGDSQ